MMNFENNLDRYAELAVKVGINIQQQQTLVIFAPIEAATFVRKVAKKAYENGAKNVHVEWSDEDLALIKFENAPIEAFKEFPIWKAKGLEELAESNAAFLSIHASNPELLKNVDGDRIAIYKRTEAKATEQYKNYIKTGKVSWSIVSIPSISWSKKVFPDLNVEEAKSKLWENIFSVTRVNEENPIDAWTTHIKNLQNKLDFLNKKKFNKLHFKGEGTDLWVELHNHHIWAGGGLTNKKGVYFVPNMPTEEVFTMPYKYGVNGTVRGTKPLNYAGQLVEDFTVTFENGMITDFTAKKGYEILKTLINTDDGSHYLGEVALVPFNSPVSNSNIIYYNTLFDENASCHLAIGAAYPLNIENGIDMSKEDLESQGANTSIVHMDFMIGSEDMDIDGETKEKELVPLFRNGNWVI